MFLFHHVRPLTKQEEAQVIYEMVRTIQWHESLHYLLIKEPLQWVLSLCWGESTEHLPIWQPRSKSGHDPIQRFVEFSISSLLCDTYIKYLS